MKIVNFRCDTPEENIALDEMLLLQAEEGKAGPSLRLWQSDEYFVVVGRSGRIRQECELDNCQRDKVKIIRRTSGGGSVLQGPGCLNFSLVLPYSFQEEYNDINSSYRVVLGRIADKFRLKGLDIQFMPLCDLALGGRKVSGNAQARKKIFFLIHGTFLYGLDTSRVSSYLKHPLREPSYRERRAHDEFLVNVPVGPGEAAEVIKSAFSPFGGTHKLSEQDEKELRCLAKEKYSLREWNYAF
ncbi:MAG: lipoate--protein ligase family protein [Candidatus Omnitrophica bacterium]|nr:lipoate--protein ligase family protein [Candidatus Omnitrophota bacterium]